MRYITLDGDDVGLQLERAYMENDEASIREINSRINSITKSISDYLALVDCSIVFCGADGVIAKGETIDVLALHEYIAESSRQFTFSIGVGSTLRTAFLSLRYAKSIGKNCVVECNDFGELRVLKDSAK